MKYISFDFGGGAIKRMLSNKFTAPDVTYETEARN